MKAGEVAPANKKAHNTTSVRTETEAESPNKLGYTRYLQFPGNSEPFPTTPHAKPSPHGLRPLSRLIVALRMQLYSAPSTTRLVSISIMIIISALPPSLVLRTRNACPMEVSKTHSIPDANSMTKTSSSVSSSSQKMYACFCFR